jgi:hypothetical protein
LRLRRIVEEMLSKNRGKVAAPMSRQRVFRQKPLPALGAAASENRSGRKFVQITLHLRQILLRLLAVGAGNPSQSLTFSAGHRLQTLRAGIRLHTRASTREVALNGQSGVLGRDKDNITAFQFLNR